MTDKINFIFAEKKPKLFKIKTNERRYIYIPTEKHLDDLDQIAEIIKQKYIKIN